METERLDCDHRVDELLAAQAELPELGFGLIFYSFGVPAWVYKCSKIPSHPVSVTENGEWALRHPSSRPIGILFPNNP